jgi:hypothetical protein
LAGMARYASERLQLAYNGFGRHTHGDERRTAAALLG